MRTSFDDYGEPIVVCGPVDYEVDSGEIVPITIPFAIDLDGDAIESIEVEYDGLTSDEEAFTDDSVTLLIDFADAQEGTTHCVVITYTTASGAVRKKRLRIYVRIDCCP